MVKAIVIMASSCDDKTAWSGTNYHIYHSLVNHFDCDYYQYIDRIFIIDSLISIYFAFLKRVFRIQRKIKPFLYQWYVSKSAVKYVRCSDAEYVFTTNSFLVPFIAKTKKKIVYISDTTFFAMINYYWFNYNKKDFAIFNKLERCSLLKSEYNFLASDWAVESAINYYKAKKNNTICIPFGANLPDVRNINRTIESKNTIHILFCGVDKVRKGLDLAINTINELNIKNHHHIILDVLGIDGTDSDNILYHGRKNKNNDEDLKYIVNIYKSCDLFFLPTLAECAGIVFCEAAMFSLPIVSHRTGGVPTYVRNGYNGVLLNIGSNSKDFAIAISKIIKDNDTYRKYSKSSRLLYDSLLSWDRWGEKIADIILSK